MQIILNVLSRDVQQRTYEANAVNGGVRRDPAEGGWPRPAAKVKHERFRLVVERMCGQYGLGVLLIRHGVKKRIAHEASLHLDGSVGRASGFGDVPGPDEKGKIECVAELSDKLGIHVGIGTDAMMEVRHAQVQLAGLCNVA